MKTFAPKFGQNQTFTKLPTLLSPGVNVLCIIGKRVAGVVQPSCFSCHPNFVKAKNKDAMANFYFAFTLG